MIDGTFHPYTKITLTFTFVYACFQQLGQLNKGLGRVFSGLFGRFFKLDMFYTRESTRIDSVTHQTENEMNCPF